MKSITVEVTKTIVVTVEAENYEEACGQIQGDFYDGEYEGSWFSAEPQFKLLDEASL